MIKSLGMVIGGIFVGAVGMEIVHKKYPKTLNKLYKKSREITSGARKVCREAKDAFHAGYKGVTLS